MNHYVGVEIEQVGEWVSQNLQCPTQPSQNSILVNNFHKVWNNSEHGDGRNVLVERELQ